MRKANQLFFSEDCPAQGTFRGPVDAGQFVFMIHDYDMKNGQPAMTECIGEFYDGTGETSSGLGSETPANSATAKLYYRIGEMYSELELGRYFCDKIADCAGPLSIDGPPHCPAMNNIELRKLG